ncbi:sulfatase [Candidatus Hydrogenedentota bacterium]
MSQQPNFLLIAVDQMQSACLGINGHSEVKTPNIDKLGSEGVTFTRAYCNNTVCTPSRATMITGLTPRGHQATTNGTALPAWMPTVTGVLADAGYSTYSAGKLHLQPYMGMVNAKGIEEPFHSAEDIGKWQSGEIKALELPYYGFQKVDLVAGHVNYIAGHYEQWLNEQDPRGRMLYAKENATYDIGAPASWRLAIPEELHYNRWIADRTMAFLEDEGNEKPFFAWCSFPDPHFPFCACEPYASMYDPAEVTLPETWQEDCKLTPVLEKRAGVQTSADTEEHLREIIAQTYGMITHIDTEIGRIMAQLEELGLAENTVVVFIADHGEYLGAHHLLYKATLPYEELFRVPHVWKLPGDNEVNGPNDALVSHLDLVPTILDLAGVSQYKMTTRQNWLEDYPVLPGKSLMPILTGEGKSVQDRVLLEYDEDWHATPIRMRALVTGRYKYVHYGTNEECVLFDLKEDPLERTNLANSAEHEKLRLTMAQDLLAEIIATDSWSPPRHTGA